ncbi:MAG: hypothetical protein QME66_10420 [Candidatus Eisenbacteria bacterium]|nr:hypothetical protein [Candidatus Eisenbacteria bacterium]
MTGIPVPRTMGQLLIFLEREKMEMTPYGLAMAVVFDFLQGTDNYRHLWAVKNRRFKTRRIKSCPKNRCQCP